MLSDTLAGITGLDQILTGSCAPKGSLSIISLEAKTNWR
jgi:hypothetical protein